MNRPELHNIYRLVISWLYPNICPCCEKYIDYNAAFCDECSIEIKPYDGSYVIKYADKFIAACFYEGIVESAVLRFKKTDCGNSYYAFAYRIAEVLREKGLSSATDLIVPIPLTKKKLSERGYNQTELMAKELRFMLNVPYENVLVKKSDTVEQKSLSASQRRENLRGVFTVSPKAADIAGKRILLIDDVCTTGSTLSEASEVLKEAGAKTVIAAAFAKTIMKDTKENRSGSDTQ